MNVLDNEQLRRKAPSVFALEPWQAQSDKYKFIPTIEVVNALRDAGFHPVSANQSNSRIEGKKEFTKHMLRFRSTFNQLQVNDVIPEIVLINSHDGTSSYQMTLGLFRCVCSNQMVVSDSQLESIRVRHSGSNNLCQDVIDISGKIIADAPKAIETTNRWNQLLLTKEEQTAFAVSAKEVYQSTLDVSPERLLAPRRYSDIDKGTELRSLWKTFNAVQENVIRGRIYGRNTAGRLMRTRSVTSVDRDVKLNKALWVLAEKMAELKASN